MKQVYLSLGSNIEPRKTYMEEAIQLLDNHGDIRVVEQSSLYETAPVDYLNQAEFLNIVIKLETTLDPFSLLEICQLIEKQLKRVKKIDKGPRTIDLDILLYGDEQIQTEQLEVPHPRMDKRAFVLVPLKEIAPKAVLVNTQQTVQTLYNRLNKLDMQGVKQWEE